MISCRKHQVMVLLLFICSGNNEVAEAFAPSPQSRRASASTPLAATGFAPAAVKERPFEMKTNFKEDSSNPNRRERTTKKKMKVNGDGGPSIDALSAVDAKSALIDLIPRMTGKAEEYQAVESYVNLLEDKYASVQTIDFLNLAMAGEWQLLFSTNLLSRPNKKLRLRELVQKIEADGFRGSLTNLAQWDYAEDGETFDANGKFAVKCSYSISQGSRMALDLNDHEIRPARGSKIPEDVPGLVGLLHRAMPKEIFDPTGHAMDTTYLDADLRIVRLTGPNHEGVRNIFMRKGSLEISPT